MSKLRYNITFVTSPDREDCLLKHIREDMLPTLFNKDSGAHAPEIRKVIEIGGEKPGENEGVSIALSFAFDTEEQARGWQLSHLLPSLKNYASKFGKEEPFFVTLIEELPL